MRSAVLLLWAIPAVAGAQTAVTSRPTNLRRDASTTNAPLRLLAAHDTITLLSTTKRGGFFHVITADSAKGWMWARNLRLANPTNAAFVAPTAPAASTATLNIAGTKSFVGCGDGLWRHVYNPARLLIHQQCVMVTGTIVDPTADNAHPTADAVRHDKDGDTHGWLKLDPQFAGMLNAGNKSQEGGNLVFELICHYAVTQDDARSSCVGYHDPTTIPSVGAHVEIRGTFVQDDNHAHWNEIHPVSSIRVIH